MLVALALDTHDDALTAIIGATTDANLVTLLETDFVRTKIRDMLFVVFGGSDKVLHRVVIDNEEVFLVGEGGFEGIEGIRGFGDIIGQLGDGGFDEEKTAHGRNEGALTLPSDSLDSIAEGDESVKAMGTGMVADLKLFPVGGGAHGEPEGFGGVAKIIFEGFHLHSQELLEAAFLIEDPSSGQKESEDNEDEALLGTLGTSFHDGDCGRLKGRESRGFLLNLHLGLLELCHHLLVDVVLELHLIFQVGQFGLNTLENHILVGI